MQTLIDTLAKAAQLHPEYGDFRELLSQVMEIDYDGATVTRAAFGVSGSYIELTKEGITFVNGADKCTLRDLCRLLQFETYLRENFLPENTQGTDDEFEI